MANKIHELPLTRGNFKCKGIVAGVKKQNFYVEKKTKNNNDFRSVNFGVQYENGKTMYMSLNGMPKDKVYFSKREDGNTVTKDVAWKDRNKAPDGMRIIGVNCGLTKTTDKDGNEVNEKKNLVEFDACKYIHENLKDDSSVFVRGSLEFSSYTDDKGELRRSVKTIPTQVSLCKDIDFDDESFKPDHDWEQDVLFMSIDQEHGDDDKLTGRFILSAKIINYNSIEDAEFIIPSDKEKLARTLRKNLKPYNMIHIFGHIENENVVEEVEEDDGWGDSNPMKRVTGSSKKEMIVIGADKESIDTDTYSEKKVEAAIKKINASKNAENTFDGTSKSNDSDSDWGDDASDDSDEPW